LNGCSVTAASDKAFSVPGARRKYPNTVKDAIIATFVKICAVRIRLPVEMRAWRAGKNNPLSGNESAGCVKTIREPSISPPVSI
jgi:hypothetical protein